MTLSDAHDPPRFAAGLVDAPDHVVLVLRGEADLAVVGDLDRLVADRDAGGGGVGGELVIDVSELEFLDCAVVAWIERQQSRGFTVRVRGARGVVARVLELVGWGDRIEP